MSETSKALSEFLGAASNLEEQSKALQRARDNYLANPEDQDAQSRFSQMSGPEGYPDIHTAAVAFQSALHATHKEGHTRGWQGGEEQVDALQQAAQVHGMDPGLFVTPEGAGNKREHILQLARLYGAKFLPGDGRSNMWDPQAHSFPDEQSAQQFAEMINHYYPAIGAQVDTQQVQSQEVGADGQPLPQMQDTWTVNFSHRQLGSPYPPGTKDHAQHTARRRSGSSPHPHHVVVDPQTGEHHVSLEPDPSTHQVVQTYMGGRSMGVQQAPPPEEEQQEEPLPGEEAPEEAPPEPAPPEGAAPVAPAAAGPTESLDVIDQMLVEANLINKSALDESDRRSGSYYDTLGLRQKSPFKGFKLDGGKSSTTTKTTKNVTSKQERLKRAHGALRDLSPDELRRVRGLSDIEVRRRQTSLGSDTEIEMDKELQEMRNLYLNSVRQAPSLMEAMPVDSNRGVTSRGNSHYDKFSSPETREKVLKSREDELDAFARSRSLPVSNIYAAAEASMRTGKVPDLGQYGLAGDDAVATKQFIISNILNIHGLEDVENDGPQLDEGLRDPADHAEATFDKYGPEHDHSHAALEALSRHIGGGKGTDKHRDMFTKLVERQVKSANKAMGSASKSSVRLRADTDQVGDQISETHGTSGKHPAVAGTLGNPPQVASAALDALRFMKPKKKKDDKVEEATEGMRKGTQAATGEWGRARGGRPDSGRIDKVQMKVGRTKRRRAGRAAADAGMAEYEAEKAEKQQSSVNFDPSRYMAEEGGPHRTGGAPERGSLSPSRLSAGPNASPEVADTKKQPLLPEKVMAQLKKEIGDRVHGYAREDLFRLARERGLLGTEESVSGVANEILGIEDGSPRADTWPKLDPELARLLNLPEGKTLAGASLEEAKKEIRLNEHDYRAIAKAHGGEWLGYVQPHQAKYRFPSDEAAQKFANNFAAKTTATPTVQGRVVSIDEPMLGESGHLGASPPGPTRSPGVHNAGSTSEAPPTKEQRKEKKPRTVSEKILGIDDEDPRSESWPKMSQDMKRLLNLESARYMAPKPGAQVKFDESPVEESTSAGMVGGFIGGGMNGFPPVHHRNKLLPPYDASADLEGDVEQKRERLRTLLKDLGLRSGE